METGRMRLKTLLIENFQSIKKLKLSFNEYGVFHLNGPNNIGKSAILKAIKILFTNVSNQQYKDFIRDGKTFFRVTMEDYDGNKVTLSRGSVDYYEWVIDGAKGRADKTGGKVPVIVEDYFNLYHEKEKTKEILNIRLPRSTMPFAETTPGDNYYILQKALGTEEYLLGIKKTEKEKRDVVKDISLIEKYEEEESRQLTDVNGKLARKKRELKEVSRYGEVLIAEYEVLGLINDVLSLRGEIEESNKVLKERRKAIQDIDMKGIEEEIQTIEAIENIENLGIEITKLSRQKKEIDNRLAGAEIEDIRGDIDGLSLMEDCLSEMQLVVKMSKEYNNTKKRLEGIEKEMDELREDMGLCPICGSDLSKVHVHA